MMVWGQTWFRIGVKARLFYTLHIWLILKWPLAQNGYLPWRLYCENIHIIWELPRSLLICARCPWLKLCSHHLPILSSYQPCTVLLSTAGDIFRNLKTKLFVYLSLKKECKFKTYSHFSLHLWIKKMNQVFSLFGDTGFFFCMWCGLLF